MLEREDSSTNGNQMFPCLWCTAKEGLRVLLTEGAIDDVSHEHDTLGGFKSVLLWFGQTDDWFGQFSSVAFCLF